MLQNNGQGGEIEIMASNEGVAILKRFLEDRYLEQMEGYPEFIVPSQLELEQIVEQIHQSACSANQWQK